MRKLYCTNILKALINSINSQDEYLHRKVCQRKTCYIMWEVIDTTITTNLSTTFTITFPTETSVIPAKFSDDVFFSDLF